MSRTPKRRERGRSGDPTRGRWPAAINTPDGTRRLTRRPRRRLVTGALILGVVAAAVAVLRAAARQRGHVPEHSAGGPRGHATESSSRIEFVDVDRPIARR
jgi:hypothetical protein